jgi:heme/copper-type cytochrome/quinol oxidase subunit 2
VNSLSWLLYWADVCDSIGDGIGFLACLLSLATIFLIAGFCVARSFAVSKTASDDDKCAYAGVALALKIVAPLTTVLVLVTLAAPSKETIYAIAASEMGEEVIKSETVSKAHRALDAWLDKQIDTKVENAK